MEHRKGKSVTGIGCWLRGVVPLAAVVLVACAPAGIAPAGRAGASPTETAAFRAEALDGQLIVEPDDGDGTILREIGGATSSIDFTMYLFTERDLIDALKRAKSRGLRVRGMLEPRPYGSGSGNDTLFKELKAAGIEMAWTNPAFQLTHEKAMVLDNREALILTLNLTRSSFTKNREFGVVDRTPGDVAEVEAAFNADWSRRSFAPSRPDLVWSPVNARAKTLGLIGSAQRSLDLFEEEMQDDQTEAAIVEAARRGVQVRVVMPAAQGTNDANDAGVRRIEQGGARVRRIADPYVHAKAIVVDGATLFLGSENVSASSLDRNREAGIILNNPDMVRRVEEVFARDFAS